MSRIEQALRRAHQEEAVSGPVVALPADDLDALPSETSDGSRHRSSVDEVEIAKTQLAAYPQEQTSPDQAPRGPSGSFVTARESGEAERPGIERLNPTLAERLVVSGEMRPDCVEQYRRLAAVLHHAQVEREIKVLMITSALPGEGKTLTAANLALTLSESYRRRVLLLDADLRQPAVHQIFQVPNVSGLTDGLKADAPQKLTVIQVSPSLSILPAGRPEPDPMSSLTSGRMRHVIEEAAAAFEWVIVDTPPIGLLPDAKLLAAMTDAAVLVIGAGTTPCKLITKAVEAVGHQRILGVVLNRAEAAASRRYHEYDDYYGYFASSSDRRKQLSSGS